MSENKLNERLVKSNPVLVDFMGLCPALAVTNTTYNALGMSAGTAFVLLGAAMISSAVRRFIPNEVRIPAYIIIIAGLVSVVDILMRAFVPELAKNLGAFVSLIVVNCLILGQVEAFSSKNPPLQSLWDAFCTAVGFTFALIMIAFARELLGTGSITLWSKSLWPEASQLNFGSFTLLRFYHGQIQTPFNAGLGGKALFLFALPAGALFVVGYLAAFFTWLRERSEKRQAAKQAIGVSHA